MDLYFSPLACSMATRIAFYEADADARYVEVDPRTKRVLADDSDYHPVSPLGLVPALRTDDGEILTENAAILQYVADRLPGAQLAPAAGMSRSRLQQWLCFIGTELHKGLFMPLLDRKASDDFKTYVLAKGRSRLAYLNSCLEGRDFLLDRFSVADAYLATVLNWSQATPMIDFGDYPAIKAYLARMRARPSIARAMAEETELFKAEIARHQAA
jgi:glutathione S-transferase